MDSTKKRASQRPRRPRTVPPNQSAATSLPPLLRLAIDVPRFLGQQAPLAVLAAQVRNASDPADKANAAGRLARQLVKRGIELREAIGLAENSLALQPDPDLALDVAGWWVEAGDLIRGAALLQTAAEELAGSTRVESLLRVARLYARSGQVPQAVQALRQAMDISPQDPRAFEAHGSLGFWAELPPEESARSYLRASALRHNRGESGPSFENVLRGFEVAPMSEDAAEALAKVLRERGRRGAADEILREHLRQGSAATRAAHHQRAFYTKLEDGDQDGALESSLEADLDLELDPERLLSELDSPSSSLTDFEAFLVARARATGEAGVSFAEWLVTLIDVHVFDWGSEQVQELRARVVDEFQLEVAPALSNPSDDQILRRLRKELGAEGDRERQRAMREEIALRECARGAWGDAFEVYEPLLTQSDLSLRSGALGVVIAGRCRQPVGRARALASLAAWLPGASGSRAFAVAAETLVAHGESDAAWSAASAAVEVDPSGERALASQALVALSAPEVASAGLLEQSLSVLVARGEACLLLCESANERGSQGLGLTWAARALALRPGDQATTSAYIRQAVATKDPEKIVDALRIVLDQNAPTGPLAPHVALAVRSLHGVDSEQAEAVGTQVLGAIGVRAREVVDALIELAKESGAPGLLAAITERQLVAAGGNERAALSLALCRKRLSAGQTAAAARALRRALTQGADRALVEESLQDFDHTVEADGQIALLEIEVEFAKGEGREADFARGEALRKLGVARWDMAQDTQGALNLWLKAADLDPHKGLEYLGHYLHHIAGSEAAAKQLQAAASQTEDPRRSAKLLGLAAHELFELNQRSEAFELARTALQRAPLMTELLSIAESCAPEHRLDELLELYDLLAESSMGCYGERAVHYRAARQLEKRGMPEQALSHACAAFEAVPAEGVAFVLMARLADSTAGHAALVASLEKVADSSPNDEERARWLSKAGALADTESIGRRQRVELLLRAAQMLPEQETISALLDSVAHYLADEPGALDEIWEKFLKVAKSALRDAGGAYGAQLALVFGGAGISHFDKPEFGLSCLSQAVELDREIPDYEKLSHAASQLAEVGEQARGFLEQVMSLVEQDTMLLGRGLAILAGRIAELLEDDATKTELLVRSASDFPEDTELVALAREQAKRSEREDLVKVVEGLLPVTDRANSVLERLDELSDADGLDELLTLDLDAAPDELRARLLEALGVRQDALGRAVDAAASFRELHELQPENDVALRGIENDADANGNYEELSRVLKTRAKLSRDAGDKRRLQLRRVAVLETRLGRGGEARELLAEMVEETQDLAALRMLADSWQRAGDQGESAELWLRVQQVAEDVEESDDAAFRAATCFSDSGVRRRAADALKLIKRPKVEHRKLGLELARASGEPQAIQEQLVGLARITVGDNKLVESLYLEAAQIALEAGDFEKAESAAKGARLALPQSAPARLLVARLRIRRGELTEAAEAREVLSDLQATDGIFSAADLEILEYCRAQALRVAESEEAARNHLEAAIEHLGARGLLALGLAELLSDDDDRALELYESAVGADLHGMRSEGAVLLAAGSIARKKGDLDRARGFVSAISDDDPMRVRAARELEQIALEQARAKREAREQREAEQERAAAEKKAAEEKAAAEKKAAEERAIAEKKAAEEKAAAEKKTAEERAVAAKEKAAAEKKAAEERAATEKKAAEERAAAEKAVEEKIAAEKKAAEEKAAKERADSEARKKAESEQKARELEAIRQAARAEHRAALAAVSEHEELAVPRRPTSAPPRQPSHPPLGLEDALVAGKMEQSVPDLSAEIEMEEGRQPLPPSSHPGDAPPVEAASTDGSFTQSFVQASDDQLVELLEQGRVDAGRELLGRMLGDRARSRDAVVVAQHLVALDPGSVTTLELLVSAANQDRNIALAAAVQSVIGLYAGGQPVVPPPADELVDEREAAIALIKQGASSPFHEALGLVWEHCQGLYKKDLAAYGISGVQRVPLSAPTPLGQLYRSASRVLGMTRTPVFRLPGQDEISLHLGLLSPPAVIVAGDITESSSELAFHFGAMLAGAIPEHALLFGLSMNEVQYLLDALALSFGSGRAADGDRPTPEVTRVASFLWETIPARAQRRLSQLCQDSTLLDYAAIASSSRRVLRRAGLLVSGDLSIAVADACGEGGLAVPTTLSELAQCAMHSPAVADLLGLAFSPEYAELRFRTRAS